MMCCAAPLDRTNVLLLDGPETWVSASSVPVSRFAEPLHPCSSIRVLCAMDFRNLFLPSLWAACRCPLVGLLLQAFSVDKACARATALMCLPMRRDRLYVFASKTACKSLENLETKVIKQSPLERKAYYLLP